jgi:hypothetical protein
MPFRQSLNHNTCLHYILCSKISQSDENKVLTRHKGLFTGQRNILIYRTFCVSGYDEYKYPFGIASHMSVGHIYCIWDRQSHVRRTYLLYLGSPVTCPSDIFTVFFVGFCMKCKILDGYSILWRLTVKWAKFSFILSVCTVLLCALTLLSSPYSVDMKLSVYLYSNSRLRSACLITVSWCGA